MFKIDFLEEKLKISASVLTCGRCLAPIEWNTKNVPNPYRLYYVECGKAYFTLGNYEFMLKNGHFYFFPSTLPFIIRQDENDRLDHMYYNFIIDPPVIASEPICASIDEHPSFSHFLSIMTHATSTYFNTKSAEDKDIARACLEAFLSLFFSVKPFPRVKDDAVLKGIEYIESHFKENISIKELSQMLYLSEDYFIRKFKNATNMTPYAYLTKLRASVAHELISNGATLKEAAEECGYQSASSLSHVLKRYMLRGYYR